MNAHTLNDYISIKSREVCHLSLIFYVIPLQTLERVTNRQLDLSVDLETSAAHAKLY